MAEQVTNKVIELDFERRKGMFCNAVDVEIETYKNGDVEHYEIYANLYATGMDDREHQQSVVGYGHTFARALQRLERDIYRQFELDARDKRKRTMDDKMFHLRVLQWIYTGE